MFVDPEVEDPTERMHHRWFDEAMAEVHVPLAEVELVDEPWHLTTVRYDTIPLRTLG